MRLNVISKSANFWTYNKSLCYKLQADQLEAAEEPDLGRLVDFMLTMSHQWFVENRLKTNNMFLGYTRQHIFSRGKEEFTNSSSVLVQGIGEI